VSVPRVPSEPDSCDLASNQAVHSALDEVKVGDKLEQAVGITLLCSKTALLKDSQGLTELDKAPWFKHTLSNIT
jgi:hypothetical protein